ncbi:protein of unknown function [Streptomyces sp. LaPpAH-199]|uniref:DUF4153 domain-containing protein n=1 Tax=Streptomyces TaxID=1883 RepID=UPI000883F4DE|nr:DUF4173 domain-containing protein [Streptomyces sp. LaPpAH-199]MYW81129.1 DUF4173 domain-containing protein [Streptomyces sp. SID8369]SDD11992.1 protein of unknown function [Streptomyces sp. LaPpAH-199]
MSDQPLEKSGPPQPELQPQPQPESEPQPEPGSEPDREEQPGSEPSPEAGPPRATSAAQADDTAAAVAAGTGSALPAAIGSPEAARTVGTPGTPGGAPGGPCDPWQYAAGPPRPGNGAPDGPAARLRPPAPPLIPSAVLWSVLATAVLSAVLLGDGLGLNLLIVAAPAALAAFFAARSAGRRLRPWTATWAVGGLALLAVPTLRDAGWPTFLAVASAFALGSLTLHGSRTWPGVLVGSVGLFDSLVPGVIWGVRGIRARADGSRARWGAALRTAIVALVLLVVFGTLFASADAAFADLLGSLLPDAPVGEAPWRILLFALGLAGALAAAYAAAAPVRWDGITVRPGRPRGRVEWALPLIVLDLLFAAFIALQLVVLLGGYEKVRAETGLDHAEYARQGFWQLLWATLLTLLVIALALRRAPRGGSRDRTLVRAVLGTLCVLTLVVVASALRRMDLYVDEYGLTRLRISVAAMELWLGVVLVLILAAGVFGARFLPRAVAVSAAAGVLAFGLLSPDALVAEQNVRRFETHEPAGIDLDYLKDLSADAVPALDRLPEPQRSCALRVIQREVLDSGTPWYATSLGEARAREILEKRPVRGEGRTCYTLGRDGTRGGYEPHGEGDDDGYDPY